MYSLLAWRNIWRNPRRTIVILTAVIIGIWSMILLGAIMRGMEAEMVRNGIATLTGSIQIHHKDYENDPVVENSLRNVDAIETIIKKHLSENEAFAKRIRVSAISSNARHSTGVRLVGIEPDKEKKISFIVNAVTKGRYFNETDTGKIIVGRKLLKKFKTRIGKKIILMSQDATKEIASKAFRIVGVFSADMESVETEYVFVPIQVASKMLQMESAVSEISIMLDDTGISGGKEKQIAEAIKADLPDKTSVVKTWRDLLPMLKVYLEMSGFFLYIWYFVVFVAMGFGIVNTTLMAVFERMREFGLMKAFGMRPLQIVRGVLTETVFLLILGISVGTIAGLISVLAISKKGIDLSALAAGAEMWGMPRILYPEVWLQDVIVAASTVLFLGLIVSMYPAIKAARFTPVEAMMQH